MMKKILFTICLFSFIGYGAEAQASYKKIVKQGDESFEDGNYHDALKQYHDALDRDKSDPNLWYKYGNAALKQHAYSKANMAFSYLVESLGSEIYPDAVYKIAELSVIEGDYEKAESYYQLYISEHGGDDVILDKKADLGLKSAIWAQEQIDAPIRATTHLGKEVNTPDSEHSPVWQDSSLNFVSLSFGDEKSGLKTSKVMVNDSMGSKPAVAGANFNEDIYITSDPSYSVDGNLMFYTKCDYDENDEIKCKIFYRVKSDGSFSLGINAGELVNHEGFTSTHPAIIEKDEKTYLYFASTRPGGKGGYDLWRSEFNENYIFSVPKNLESINTEFDDITPHYQKSLNNLYFSSNGREGFGGYDIYVTQLEDDHKFGIIENLGMDVNSSYNDLHFFESEDGQEAYLSSNRKGSFYSDEGFETCCFDIYQAEPRKCEVDIKALVFDQVDSSAIIGANIIIKEKSSGLVVFDKFLPSSNEVDFYLDCLKDYEVTASKDGYLPSSFDLNFSDRGLELNQSTEDSKIYLVPSIANLNILAFDLETKESLIGATLILVDEASGEEIKKYNEFYNEFVFPVKPGKTYIIKSSKPGYIASEDRITIDSGSKEISKDVFLKKTPIEKKIVSLEKVLPIRLFFDNDHPNPSSTATTTSIRYRDTYVPYYAKKPKFKSMYAQKFSGQAKQDAQYAIDNFFENELRRNHDNLNQFLATLLEVLEVGRNVNLYFRGYASPVAVSDYNLKLGQRRIKSMLLEVNQFKGGALVEYIDSGQLVLTERSFGESDAPSSISDDRSDPSSSIFSPDASKERRVEIEEIRVNRGQ